MSARDAARYAGSRLLTAGCYVGGVIGTTNWDSSPDSWRLIAFHLMTPVVFLWLAVSRTIRHYHEDHPSGGDES